MAKEIKSSVPAVNDPLVALFSERFQITSTPVHLQYVNHGYDPNFCHMSAKHCAMSKGGRRVHGWALWNFDDTVIGEHHSVWESPEGDLVDVTPPKFGADHILFIRDDASDLIEMQGVYVMWADRTTIPDYPFAFQGNPHPEMTWGLPPTDKNIITFCAKFGLKPSDIILTDERFG